MAAVMRCGAMAATVIVTRPPSDVPTKIACGTSR
jgi:hypothetical protein